MEQTSDITPVMFREMFEGDFAEMFSEKFPLMLMGTEWRQNVETLPPANFQFKISAHWEKPLSRIYKFPPVFFLKFP
jgi:hypothetical protein